MTTTRVAATATINSNLYPRRPARHPFGGSFLIVIADMLTIANIVDAVAFPFTVWRTLQGIEPEIQDGRPRYVTGNAAVSLPVRYHGRRYMLKCYTRPNDRLPAIYGEAFRPKELCVVDFAGRYHWVDCLLTEYVEGRSLDEVLCEATTEEEFSSLARAFDSMAGEILRSERAHGDLKPENIIVREDGSMVAIDWDAAFVPMFKGMQAVEIGTAAYQHPRRDTAFYDKHLDDYSVAFISTLLHLAALRPDVMEHYRQHREPPFTPVSLISGGRALTAALHTIVEEFARRGMAREYQVAMMLGSQYVRLYDLAEVFSCKAMTMTGLEDAELEMNDKGRWGVLLGEKWILPPLYTSGIGLSEGVALMELGAYRHFVCLRDGVVLRSFSREENVGPLRDGCTLVRTSDGEERIIRVVVE